MATASGELVELLPEVCGRATDARDPRFDGVFFVGITTTRVYCRPVCPARIAYQDHRRFFTSAAAAERAGFRPCLRCRPELAPGRATIDPVYRLAAVAAQRIAAGALNGRSVAALACELGVTDRHLRRALEREIGVSPVGLARTHRLLLAKQLLADTALSITRIAYASGFQSLRRFNTAFRAHYRMAPSVVRRPRGAATRARAPRASAGAERDGAAITTYEYGELVRLKLPYREPFAWRELLAQLEADAMPGVAAVVGTSYGRTIALDGKIGVIFLHHAARARAAGASPHVFVDVSESLVPLLMPLLAKLRRLLDLDAEPLAIDEHLAQGGLGALVSARPGLRLPGTLDAFEVAVRVLLSGAVSDGVARAHVVMRFASALGEPIASGHALLTHLAPSAARVAEAGVQRLSGLGVPERCGARLVRLARLLEDGELRLEPCGDPTLTHRALVEGAGLDDAAATMIVMRALYWPDAFPASDCALQRAARAGSRDELVDRAERWRPWRAYAALHLWLRRPAP